MGFIPRLSWKLAPPVSSSPYQRVNGNRSDRDTLCAFGTSRSRVQSWAQRNENQKVLVP